MGLFFIMPSPLISQTFRSGLCHDKDAKISFNYCQLKCTTIIIVWVMPCPVNMYKLLTFTVHNWNQSVAIKGIIYYFCDTLRVLYFLDVVILVN